MITNLPFSLFDMKAEAFLRLALHIRKEECSGDKTA